MPTLKDSRVVCGDPDLMVPSHLNYGKHILGRLQLFGNNDALVNGETGEKMSYSQLLQRAVNMAMALHERGVSRGDMLALLSENRFEYFVAALGAFCCGAVVAPANVLYTRDELINTLNISKPKYIVCSEFALKAHCETLKSLSFIKTIIQFGDKQLVPGWMYSELIRRDVEVGRFEPTDVRGQADTALVLCSSGTTGLPKGVELTHLNLLLSAVHMSDSTFAERELQRFLTIVPWHHGYGFMTTINLLCAGTVVVYLPRFRHDLYLETIQKYKINVLLAVPPLVVFLAKSPLVLNYDTSSLREIWCGAAPLTVDIIEATMKRFPTVRSINQAYGMTETSLAATRDQMVLDGSKAGSGGSPVPGTKIKVVDLESREILGPYEKGEICIKGAIIMKGYIGEAAATKGVFDDEGYLQTGDIGYYDSDNYFYIVDRVKELIKYKGFQVAPAEVEAVLLQHPGVAECGVVGAPDEAAGELPTAFVVLQPGATVTKQELVDFVASKLSHSKRLHGGVRFVTEVPKNPSGKILRRELRRRCLDRPASKL